MNGLKCLTSIRTIKLNSMTYDPICIFCKHLVPGMTCPAYPLGIPEKIYQPGGTHSEVMPDQVGETIFEPVEPAV